MIHFGAPEFLLLALPVLALLWTLRASVRPAVLALRLLLVVALAALLAEPFVAGRESGRDLILVVDRSLSVPGDQEALVGELEQHAADAARAGDRVGVVLFGLDSVVEQPPVEGFHPGPFAKPVDRTATDLAGALETALALVPPGRQGSLLVLSDGESTGREPAAVAREAARRGLRIDVWPLRRIGAGDVSIDEVLVPGEVEAGEPFQWSAWVRSDRATEATVRLLRDGAPLGESPRTLRPGANRLVFRDRLLDPGLHRYEVVVDAGDDRVPENNRGLGVLRVTGGSRVLCLTPGGREDRLTRSLAAAGLSLQVVAPEAAPLESGALDAVRAVVLENVPAGKLPSGGLAALASFVEDFGGGLLMTGGKASFGAGGYRRSRVEDVLPITLEVRQEQRRFALAMAIALDRSGSMSAATGDGRTKMDLADLGACAAVELLGPRDSLSVIAVDSAPHVIVPITPIADADGIMERIRSIESQGGGIFIGEALHAAADQLAAAPQQNKHIVLFADAADSEEPTDYATFVPALVDAGVTVSVIGLGSESDSDAKLLQDIARLGGGRVFFTSDASDLPRVFAEETIQVARSSFVEEPTPGRMLPDLIGLGEMPAGEFPTLGGYSVGYVREGTTVGVLGEGESDEPVPLLSFRQAGLGRSVGFLGEADGEFSGGLAGWEGYGGCFTTLVRWASGSEASGELYAELLRDGHEAVLEIEAARDAELALDGLTATLVAPDGSSLPLTLTRLSPTRLQARAPLRAEGAWRAVVATPGGGVLRVPPVSLAYSPEFAPALDPQAGERRLAALAQTTGGRVQPPVSELLAGSRVSGGITALGPWLAGAALLLLLLEIAVRRLDLPVPGAAWVAATWRSRRAAVGPTTRREISGKVAPPPSVPSPAAGPGVTGREVATEEPAGPEQGGRDLQEALERAKQRARRS
jgi:Mg-chelatase subunit ChlD